MSNFPNNLSILRRQAGYTQEGLAEALGVSRQAVSKWESGQTLPEAATLLTLADLLGCSLDQLMREELTEADCEAAAAFTQEEAWAVDLFRAYDAHRNRHAVMIAGGVALILMGVAAMMGILGLWDFAGLGVLALLIFVAAAVFLFILSGGAHEDFQRRNPVIPDLYPPEERARISFFVQVGTAAAVGVLLLDVGLLVGLMELVEGQEPRELLVVALFMLISSGAIGTLVLLGALKEKYDLVRYEREALKLIAKGNNQT